MPINLIWSLPYRVRDDVDRVVEGAVQVKMRKRYAAALPRGSSAATTDLP